MVVMPERKTRHHIIKKESENSMSKKVKLITGQEIGPTAIIFHDVTGAYNCTVYATDAFNLYTSAITFLPMIIDYVHKRGSWNPSDLGLAITAAIKEVQNHLDDADKAKFEVDLTKPINQEKIAKCSHLINVDGQKQIIDFSDYIVADSMDDFKQNLAPSFVKMTHCSAGVAVVEAEYNMIHMSFENLTTIATTFYKYFNQLSNSDFIDLKFNNTDKIVQE